MININIILSPVLERQNVKLVLNSETLNMFASFYITNCLTEIMYILIFQHPPYRDPLWTRSYDIRSKLSCFRSSNLRR